MSAGDEHVNREFAVHERIKRGDQPADLLTRHLRQRIRHASAFW
jgi:hypothetical protein